MQYLYVGTFTKKEPRVCEGGHGKGIYVFQFDLTNGQITRSAHSEAFDVGVSPSWVCISHNRKWAFSNNEDQTIEKGTIRVSKIRQDRGLTQLGIYNAEGKGPSHLVTSRSDRHLLITNYRSGSVVDYEIDGENGTLKVANRYQQEGASRVNPTRQECPHAHGIFLTPDEKYAYVPDLGNDRVWQYTFSDTDGLKQNAVAKFVQAPLGCGPRHLDVSPNGRYAYLSAELTSQLIVYAIDQSNGTLKQLQILSTLPEGCTTHSENADIHVSPNGRNVYVSNRGHDSIAAYELDQESGLAKTVQFEKSGGEKPRNFIITKCGKFMLVANQDTDNIVVFEIDGSGKLKKTNNYIHCPSPVCLQLVD